MILPMDHQRGGLTLLAIHKQNNHLTGAVLHSVMRAGTFGVGQAGILQIERLHDAKTGACQPLLDPHLYLVAGLIENQNRNESAHFESC